MNTKILAFAGIAVIGAMVSIGSADNVIRAYVQQFGATDHVLIRAPGNVDDVQIDWRIVNDGDVQEITACLLTFDNEVPAGTAVTCKLSGHDADPFDGKHDLTTAPIVATATIVTDVASQVVVVPVEACNIPDFPEGSCDIQGIEDVKVILVGKDTTEVVVESLTAGNCLDGIDNDRDGKIDIADENCEIPIP